MKTIILGKVAPTTFDSLKGEVYQPFSIKSSQNGVSRKHATITINDYNEWWLEDQWSTNGTFIREDDGSLRKIGDRQNPGKCRISPMTFIKLGDNSTGCSFYAKQANCYGDFNEEFEYIEKKWQQLSEVESSSKRKIKWVSIFFDHVLPVVLALILILFIRPYFEKDVGIVATIVTGSGFWMVMHLSRMTRFFYSPQEKEKEVERSIKETKKNFSNCPNPLCNHILTGDEIGIMQCKTCNIQHN